MNSAEVLIKFNGDIDNVEQAQKKVEDNFSSLQKKGEIAFLGLTAAADAFAVSVLKSGIEYNAQIETYLTRLTTLTGSAEEANAILDQIKQDALSTPFDVSSLTQAESLLLSTGLSAEQSRGDILALGDAIAASGGGNEELQRMAVNLQQIKNVGKASSLDIKQFAYAGVDIYGLLADSMGVTREEASQMTVTYDMLSTALQNASQKGGKYYGAMENQSKTYAGSMSNLKEAVQVFKGEIAEGLFNAFKKIIPQLTKFFNWLTKNKKIIIAIAVPLLTFINIIAGFLIIKKIVGLFSSLWAILSANPIVLIIAAIAALVAGFIYLWNNCEAFRNFFIGLWEAIKNVVGAAIDVIVGLVKSWISTIKAIISPIIEFIKGIIEAIKVAIQIVVEIIIKIVENLINIIKGIINTAIAVFKAVFITIPTWIYNTIIKPVANFFKGLWDGFKNGAKAAWNGIKSIFSAVGGFFKDIFTKAWNIVENIFNGIKNTISTVFEFIKNNIVSPVVDFFTGIFESIKSAADTIFNGMKDIIEGVFNTLVDIIKTPINLIIDAVNTVIRGLNKISIKIPDWVPGFGGQTWGINIGQIPRLDVGTNYVPEDTLAMVHKGEAVIPKKFNPYANMNNSMLGVMQNQRQTQVINVYASFKQDSLGQTVRNIKTFSGGARNDYNYGVGA